MSSSAYIANVKEGDILAGKYRVDRVLGSGGMGVVVAAHHMRLDERVAIKFLLPDALGNVEAVARFEREARAAVKIKSEHVARVIDVGTLESGAPYIVMEYLEGGDLCAWLQTRGALPIEQAVEFVLQACEAVADAHGLGIVHRDLKPANLFCIRRSDGLLSVKVLDFGISKMTNLSSSGSEAGITKTAVAMGSPLYMSPEQMRSARDVDARADIWALGVILYELLAGKPPFQGESMPELVLRIATEPPAPLRARRNDVPPALEAVILRCLEKDRTKRFKNVAELAWGLADFGPKRARASAERAARILQASGVSANPLDLQAVPAEAVAKAGMTEGAWGRTRTRTGWGGGKLSATLIVACGVLGAGAFFWMRWSGDGAGRSSNAAPPREAPAAVAAPEVPPPAVVSPPPTAAVAEPTAPPRASASTGDETSGRPVPSALAGTAAAPASSLPVRPSKVVKPVAVHPAAPTPKPAAPATSPADPFAQPK